MEIGENERRTCNVSGMAMMDEDLSDYGGENQGCHSIELNLSHSQ